MAASKYRLSSCTGRGEEKMIHLQQCPYCTKLFRPDIRQVGRQKIRKSIYCRRRYQAEWQASYDQKKREGKMANV